MASPRVLFVSKAITPPFHDGACCLVRDLANALSHCQPTVMTSRQAPTLAPHVKLARLYPGKSAFAPPLLDNVRVLGHLLLDHSHELWHFVFAPNPLSSHSGSVLKRLRQKPIVQTIASRPRSFDNVAPLLFGDQIVALSKHTADSLIRGGAQASRLQVIPPPITDLERTEHELHEARVLLGIAPKVPLFVYAGDLEFSDGAWTFASAVEHVLKASPEAVFAFACRTKTPRSLEVERNIQALLRPYRTQIRFTGEIEDLPALLGSATAVSFAVNQLYGKVDLPYAALEACLLRVPVIVARNTPLEELTPAPAIEAGDVQALTDQFLQLLRDQDAARSLGEQLRLHVLNHHGPETVARAYEQLYQKLLG